MKILSFQEFLNEKRIEKIDESGNAFDGTSPIPAEYQIPTFNVLKKELFTAIGIDKEGWAGLGSTFKKKPGMTSGDMDFAINGLVAGAHLGVAYEDVPQAVLKTVNKLFPKYETTFRFGDSIFILKFPQYDERGKKTEEWVQIDFMIVDDLELAKYMFHSPDFTKDESQYKGLFRNILLMDIIGNIEIEKDKEYYKDEFGSEYAGLVKTFNKYSITAQDGLKIQRKTYDGKKGRKKNAAVMREHDKIITKDVNEITKFALGPDATVQDTVSFESVWRWVLSDKFVHKHKRKEIIDTYVASLKSKNFPIPTETADYLGI